MRPAGLENAGKQTLGRIVAGFFYIQPKRGKFGVEMTQTLINYHKLIEKCTHMLFQLGRSGGEAVVVRGAGLLSRALGLENEAIEGRRPADVSACKGWSSCSFDAASAAARFTQPSIPNCSLRCWKVFTTSSW